MKRILFCASILALAASCTQDEFDTNSSLESQQLKGITFTSVTPETPTTRGDLVLNDEKNGFNYFWYAEQDRINIWSTWTTNSYGTNNISSGNGTWDTTKKAIYKATQSTNEGVFTGISDENILDFNGGDINDSHFFAAYPGDKGSVEGIKIVGENPDGTFVLANLPSLKDQTQTNKNNAIEMSAKQLMYSYSTGSKDKSYTAVGENINLQFTRPFTAALFSTKGADDYKSLFGDWTKVTLEMKGYDGNEDGEVKAGSEGDIMPSIIDYGTVNYAVMPDETYKDVAESSYFAATTTAGSAGEYKAIEDWTTISNASSKLDLTISGLASTNWSSSDYAYMAMNRVDRSDYPEGASEEYTITYSFQYIDLSDTRTSSKNWPSVAGNNAFIDMPLDMSKYPYLVTKDRDGENTRALIVLSGNFDDIYVDENGVKKVKWQELNADGEMEDVNVALTEFTTIQSKVALDKDELAGLKNFTALHDIKLEANTEIPYNTFTQTTLKEINFPMVDDIDLNAFASSIELETVILPAYDFGNPDNEDVALRILKKNSLKVLDMSAVTEMAIGFPSTGFTLNGYTNLTTVTVNPNELTVGANAFNGCISLTSVDGKVKLNGTAAFKGTKISTINITNTNIPVSAFENCSNLKNVYYNGSQVMPTRVAAKAFYNCSVLERMDLSNAANGEDGLPAIGNEAFRNCRRFVGSVEGSKKVLYVGGQTIGRAAFAGCNELEHVEFLQATQLNDQLFYECELTQIQFDVKVDVNYTTYSSTMFGSNTKNVDLFVVESQDNYDDGHLYMKGATIEFKSVQVH